MKNLIKILFISTVITLYSCPIYSFENLLISNIYIKGNKITNCKIIYNELPFKTGDVVQIKKLENLLQKGRNNLINLSLFNDVEIIYKESSEQIGSIDVFINLDERWYYWPLLSIVFEDRNLSTWLKNADFNKVTIDIGTTINNIRGLNQTFTASYKFGYQKGLRLEYDKVNIDSKGIHYLDFGFYAQLSKTVNFYSFFNTPSYIKSIENYLEENYTLKISYTYRPRLRVKHNIGLLIDYTKINDTILKLNPNYWGDNKTSREGFDISYTYINDQRDNYQYPTDGYIVKGEIGTYFTDDMSVRQQRVKADIQFYLPITNNWNISSKVMAGTSVKNVNAYILDRAIGYNNVSLRGYEYYAIDGQHYLTFCPTIKYKVLSKKSFTMNFLAFLPKFNKIHFTIYAKSYLDMGYTYNKHRRFSDYLSNRLLYSGGLGLDIVSYYDTTLSIDYSINQFQEKGFFFSIKSPLF